MGKLAPRNLKKLLSYIKEDPRIVVPPTPGFDSGVHLIGDDKYLVVSTDPCIGVPRRWFGWLLIHYAASDLALFGAKPEFCTINLLAPPSTKPEIFYEIAPDKGSYRNDILKVLDKASRIQPKSGVVTQMIIGLGETDRDVLYTTYRLLKDFKLRRVYYSPFKPVKDTPLENVKPCPSYRSKLLYQAFFLLRDYVFELKDLVSILDDNEMLPKTDDLKTYLAKKVDLKVDLDSASLKDILKIPGIGLKTAKAIIKLRDNGLQITPYVLKRLLGVSRFKKVVNFIDYKNTKLLAK